MKKKNTFHFLIPEKVINKIAEIEKAPQGIPGFRFSNVMEIIHLIETRKREDGYSHLKMMYLKKIIPTAEKYIHLLLNLDIIQRDEYYQPGNKSYGYRINQVYDSKYKFIPLTDAKLLRRIRRINSFSHTGSSCQKKWIHDFTIDPAALTFAEMYYTDPESLKYAIAAIQKILNEEKYYTIDDTAGRCHTNITSFPKEMRPYIISHNGKHLTHNVDIKNSQPYFSTLIFTAPEKIAPFAKNKELRMILKSLQVQQNEDVKLYINLVCEGNFYEYLVTEFSAKGLNYTRDQVKKSVMQILFDANSHLSKERKIFAELFPTVHDTFNLIRGNSKGDHFTSYKRFAILLQTIEAHVILKVILKRVNIEHPDIITFTVHDSLLTTSDPEKVQEIMNDELTKICGRKPILKIERLNERITERNNKGRKQGKGNRYYDSKSFVKN